MQQELVPGLVVAHSHRLEDLTSVAVTFMANYPLAPLEEETVLVQSNGIAQWLKINLAEANGIAAMLNVTLPARFVWKAYRAVLGDSIPKESPFDKDRLTWRIMRILPKLVAANQDGVFSSLANYLGASAAQPSQQDDQRKLFQLSQRIADLFDQYQNYRADWLDHWSAGRDFLDNDRQPVPEKDLWQPQLWRALVTDIGPEHFWTNRAELHRQFTQKAKALTQRPANMPPRLLIFGISSLPQQTLEVLDAIKGFTQVVLCVHNPCQHYWANIVDGKEALKQVLKQAPRRHELKADMAEDIADDELHHHAQPLLAAWGKQGRDYIHLLDLYDETLAKQEAFESIRFELFDETPAENLLQQLQNDVLNLRPLHETQEHWPPVAAHDRSLQFHNCHSIQREVEVLHDQLLAAFANDKELRPRDIMVMVPDVNAYAPHVQAVFGRLDRQDPRHIPFTIADQGQRHQQPLMVALELLLSLEQSRVTQADVFSLLSVPALQQRFGFSQQEIIEVQRWLDDAGARWGLDAQHRAQFGMPEQTATNSWWFALERMVFGYAIGRPASEEQARWHDIEPYHEVAGLSADAVGKLASLIEALNQWWHLTQQRHAMVAWAQHAGHLLARFFAATDDDEQVLLTQLQQVLESLQEVVSESGLTADLELSIFKESWMSQVDQPNLNQRFLAGAVNFATLMPMRAIPFRHIYVLGMNDDAYPRRQPSSDFDLMVERYRPGDRARRDDDRYLFLEALLSARDCFSMSWVGHSAQDNSEWPPSVLIAQLREHIQQGWRLERASGESKDLLANLTCEHKLQAFNPLYLQYSTPQPPYFTYMHEWLAAHTDSADQQLDVPPWQADAQEQRVLNVRDLVKFLREPAQPFFNYRLDTYFVSDENQTNDSEAFSLDGISAWQIKEELLAGSLTWLQHIHAHTPEQLAELEDLESLQTTLQPQLARMQREGRLGVEPMTTVLANRLFDKVTPQLQHAAALLQAYPIAVPDRELDYVWGEFVLRDVAQQLYQNELGEQLQLLVSSSRLSEKHEFLPYVKHLLLSLVSGNRVTTVALFAPDQYGNVKTLELPPLNRDQSVNVITELLSELRRQLSSPCGTVGELALSWLETYTQAISGSKPNAKGKQNTAPVSAEEAIDIANEKVLETIDSSSAGDLSAWRYAGRIESDAATMLASDSFWQLLERVYGPFVRLKHGQPIEFALPESDFAEQADSKTDSKGDAS
ncbi:MAG: exodeoxyribonuclease V subunit gamma [Aliidiomarina sp.]|uniref:exodeoxyribonuclease V subunit gamma n=1 Tax=Aliidiomarina sp. TaxID=1872439 RepID=UPI0025B7EF1C|nr:exodeoxyribonuclease V subunit gamma [Aliidiomarina sp.]MCH8500797.1 exodeoxyribonuclease V subunit gamma [Aliidiomarina sp.]